jgi:hypothetical protein
MSVGGIQSRPPDFPLQSPPDPHAPASGAAIAQATTDSAVAAAAAAPPHSTVSANSVDETV